MSAAPCLPACLPACPAPACPAPAWPELHAVHHQLALGQQDWRAAFHIAALNPHSGHAPCAAAAAGCGTRQAARPGSPCLCPAPGPQQRMTAACCRPLCSRMGAARCWCWMHAAGRRWRGRCCPMRCPVASTAALYPPEMVRGQAKLLLLPSKQDCAGTSKPQ